jgi:hypothetical protein
MATARGRSSFKNRLRAPRIDLSKGEFLVCIIHSNRKQLNSLRRTLNGSTFYVKAIDRPEPVLGHHVMVTKLRYAERQGRLDR